MDGNLMVKCLLCGKISSDRSNMRKHVENVHLPNTYVYTCNVCGQAFGKRNLLNHHMHKHKVNC